MAYPQPDATKYAIKGYEYFRLNTLLASAGDIYESEQSALAFALGPDSDIANVGINYFDEQVPNALNQVFISKNRSFVGRIDANAENGTYQPSGRPARIFIWPNDRWNPLFVLGDVGDTQILETPQLDVIQYFQPQPSGIVPGRNDKIWFYQTIATPGGDNYAYVIVPYYGRRYAKVMFENLNVAEAFDVKAFGVELQQQQVAGGGGAGDVAITTPLVASAPYSNVTTPVQIIVKNGASPTAPTMSTQADGGMFDLLAIGVRSHGGGGAAVQNFCLKIVTSDNVGGGSP